jgi:Tfp pilus assembly protein PilF
LVQQRETGASRATPTRSERVRREGLKLVLLIVCIAIGFMLTRAAAARMHAISLREAAEWESHGSAALAAGQVGTAVDAFRQAVLRDRANRQYTASLAQALLLDHQSATGEQLLLTLRESEPDDPAINLQLARLAGGRGDVTTALRFYRSALYAPWQDAAGPGRVRRELIEFLLSHGDTDRATAELLAARANAPDTAAGHVELGSLFVRAGNQRLAHEEFVRALVREPRNAAALAGAGETAFALGDYETAVRFLTTTVPLSAAAVDTRTVAALVVAHDPLGRRLAASTRRARLVDAVQYVRERATACAPDSQVTLPDVPRPLDTDAIEDELTAIGAAVHTFESQCPPLMPLDRALLLIVRRHDLDHP